jgi:hypothetical protein
VIRGFPQFERKFGLSLPSIGVMIINGWAGIRPCNGLEALSRPAEPGSVYAEPGDFFGPVLN